MKTPVQPVGELLSAFPHLEPVPADAEREIVNIYRARFSRYFPHQGAERKILFPDNPTDTDNGYEDTARQLWEEAQQAIPVPPHARLVLVRDSQDYPSFFSEPSAVTECLGDLISLPHHLYIVDAEVNWCICYRMEGDMGFGFRQDGERAGENQQTT